MSSVKRYFTIGMAGHIDHGKTTLTKALTGVDTDRLKEEKERNISIELGFAPFISDEDLEVSLIDVPGHENFIRQMITGVAGIDLVLLVIAADEGIMPQTKEHLAILKLLGIDKGFVVLTKTDQADPELLELVLEDINDNLKDTFFKDSPIFHVDSILKKGIPELKDTLRAVLVQMKRKETHIPFRLPIDHVFTVKGKGVIVRGTIYNGDVNKNEQLKILPSNKEVRVRQIQTHGQAVESAHEGQRTAINLGGVSLQDISRGNVLVKDSFYSTSGRIDVVFHSLKGIKHPIKQRQRVKLHIATTEVMAKIVFFDRNEIIPGEEAEVLCQLEIEEKIVALRTDRFILRRPSPTETIGGGWIIDPNANKYRFGKDTINKLALKQEGTVKDRINALLIEKKTLTKKEILKYISITEQVFNNINSDLLEINNDLYTQQSLFDRLKNKIVEHISLFNKNFPMRTGMNRAELISEMSKDYPQILLEKALESLSNDTKIILPGQYISLSNVSPSLPLQWEKKLESIEKILINQGIEPEKWDELISSHIIPDDILKEYYYFLIQTNKAFIFDHDRLISQEATIKAIEKLILQTEHKNFSLQIARDILQLSRKNLVPFLELMDELEYTRRNENQREWIEH